MRKEHQRVRLISDRLYSLRILFADALASTLKHPVPPFEAPKLEIASGRMVLRVAQVKQTGIKRYWAIQMGTNNPRREKRGAIVDKLDIESRIFARRLGTDVSS